MRSDPLPASRALEVFAEPLIPANSAGNVLAFGHVEVFLFVADAARMD